MTNTNSSVKLLNLRENELITQALKGSRVVKGMKSATRFHVIRQKKQRTEGERKVRLACFQARQGVFQYHGKLSLKHAGIQGQNTDRPFLKSLPEKKYLGPTKERLVQVNIHEMGKLLRKHCWGALTPSQRARLNSLCSYRHRTESLS